LTGNVSPPERTSGTETLPAVFFTFVAVVDHWIMPPPLVGQEVTTATAFVMAMKASLV
jgi:hypothetical protein